MRGGAGAAMPVFEEHQHSTPQERDRRDKESGEYINIWPAMCFVSDD
jgi:hypothetical protein